MQRGPHFPRNALLIGVAVALVLAATYVVGTLRPAAQSSGVKVLTTFYPVYDYTRNIGGDRINVSRLVPMTLDVHAVEPTPSSVPAVAAASIPIYNGGGREPWSPSIGAAPDNPRLRLGDARANLPLRRA